MVTGPACPAPASVSAAEVEALVTRGFFDWIAYRPVAAAPPDLAPFEQAVALAKAEEAKWKEAAVAGTVAPEVVGPAYDAAKARREDAEQRLFEARQTAGLDDQRLTLAERWGTMSVPERRRALQAFEVVASVERGRQPLDERLTIELRSAPASDGWEPDVEYTLPSDQELAETITAEYAAAGPNIPNVADPAPPATAGGASRPTPSPVRPRRSRRSLAVSGHAPVRRPRAGHGPRLSDVLALSLAGAVDSGFCSPWP